MMRVDSRKFLSVGVLVLISTLAVNGATSRETAIVKDVAVNNSGDALEVKITATEESRFTYFELNKPRRLVVDFHGIKNTIGFRQKTIDSDSVERVRTSYFSDKKRKVTRIVFDLKDDVPYRFLDDRQGIVRIVFGETTRAPMNLTAGPPVVPEFFSESVVPSVPKFPPVYLDPSILAGQLLPEPPPAVLAAPVATVAQLAPPPAAVQNQQAQVRIVPQPAPSIPAGQLLPEPPPLVRAAPVATVAQLAPPPAAVQNQQTQIRIVPPTAPQVPAMAPTPTPQYTGELINLDLKDYDIKDFFRLISELSGLNVVLDPNVAGTVTIKMTDVPWDQALDVVLKNYQLGGQLQGNVLRIATNATLQAEEGARKSLRDAQDQATPLATRTFILNYTKADAVSATLKSPGLLSARGSIIQDVRRNALIISDIPSQFNNIDTLVKFLDVPAQQVEIEGRLLSAVKSFSRDLGTQLGVLFGARNGSVLTGVPGTSSPFARTPSPRVATGAGIPLVANFPAGGTSGLSFLLNPGGDILLDEIITAAEAKGTARLISRPNVVTQNNLAATVSQGTQIPVQTNVNNTISTQFLSFTLNLNVTPQITEAGTILLTVAIENSQPDFARAVNGVPSVSTQRAQTQVLIPDGGTAVIGGILLDSDSINIRQVPGLGSIPIVGNLFKSTQTIKSTSELVFFVTARIKTPDALTLSTPGEENPQGKQQ